jgi:hypothetical protein
MLKVGGRIPFTIELQMKNHKKKIAFKSKITTPYEKQNFGRWTSSKDIKIKEWRGAWS